MVILKKIVHTILLLSSHIAFTQNYTELDSKTLFKTELEQKIQEKNAIWKIFYKNSNSIKNSFNDDGSVNIHIPTGSLTVQHQRKRRRKNTVYNQTTRYNLVFDKGSDEDQLCKFLSKSINIKNLASTSTTTKIATKYSKWMPDTHEVSTIYSAFVKVDGNIQTLTYNPDPYIRRITCHFLKNIESPISTRYKKISLEQENQVRIQSPKFKVCGKKRGFSSINNLDTICQHFGLEKYIKSSLVTEKKFFPKDVILDENRRFKDFQTDRRIPQIKEIICSRAQQ